MTGGWRIAVRNLSRNRRRNVTTGLAIALGYAALVVLGGYRNRSEGLLRTSSVFLQHFGHLSVYRPDGFERAAAKPSAYSFGAEEQRAIAAILSADPRVEFFARYLRSAGLVGNGCTTRPFYGLGVELDAERRIQAHPEVRRWAPDLGAPLAGERLPEAAGVESPLALSYGLGTPLGKRPIRGGAQVSPLDCSGPGAAAAVAADPYVQLAGLDFEGGLSAVDATLVSIFRAPSYEEDKAALVTDLATLQRLLGTDHVTSFSVFLRDRSDVGAVERDLGQRLRAAGVEAEIHRYDDPVRNQYYVGTMTFLRSLVSLIGLIVVMVAVLSVLNAMTLTILERTRELATFRSLGFTRRQVVGLFLREAALLTAVGVTLGLALGLAAAALVNGSNVRYAPPGMAGTIQLRIIPDAALCVTMAVLYFPLSLAATWIAVRRRVARPVADLLTAVAA